MGDFPSPFRNTIPRLGAGLAEEPARKLEVIALQWFRPTPATRHWRSAGDLERAPRLLTVTLEVVAASQSMRGWREPRVACCPAWREPLLREGMVRWVAGRPWEGRLLFCDHRSCFDRVRRVRIFGFHPVREALRHRPHELARVWVSAGRRGARRDEIETLCRRNHVAVTIAEDELLAELAPTVHNGFVAELAERPASRPGGDSELIVLCEDIQDPRNLGALLRVCEGAGVGRVLIRDRGSAPMSPTVVKASAGASEVLASERIVNTALAIDDLKRDGYWVYGLAAEGEPPWGIDLSGKVVFCVGGEEKGLRFLTRQRCDRLIGLPMRGRVESLNLATAAAAVLYEAVRQRSLRVHA